MIEAAGATHPLTELLHSHNEGVAAYAKEILYRINGKRPVEMANSYQRDDTAWPNDIGLGPDLQVC